MGYQSLERSHSRVALALLVLALVGCTQPTTTLLVHVQARPGLGNPAALVATFSQQGEELRSDPFRRKEGTITLPATFAIRSDGRAGEATLSVEALDENGFLLGKGEATAKVESDTQVDVTVLLDPYDFTINGAPTNVDASKQYLGGQTFGDLPARQLASNGKDTYVVTWTDGANCNGPRADGACVIWYRLFNSSGAMMGQAVAGAFEDKSHHYTHPAVAMQATDEARFAFAWERLDSPRGVYFRAFAPVQDADNQSAVNADLKETEISTQLSAGNPDIAALADSTKYVIVWRQHFPETSWQVNASIVTPGSAPAQTLSITAVDPTVICGSPPSPTCDGMQLVPAVAAGARKGFMVAWKEGTSLKGSIYLDERTPSKEGVLAIVTGSDVERFDVASLLSGGYVVIWSEQSSTCKPTDADGRCIRMRRFLPAGTDSFKAEESAYTLNTTAEGDQVAPAIARGAAGTLLAVWTDRHSTDNEDPVSSIRGRLVLDMGLPVGDDFHINTTLPGAQELPAVAPFSYSTDTAKNNGYIVAFLDDSTGGPDSDGGLRGRLIYPNDSPTDTKLGSLCTPATPCANGLACFPGKDLALMRCVPSDCDTAKKFETCTPGSQCNILSAEGKMCNYSSYAPPAL